MYRVTVLLRKIESPVFLLLNIANNTEFNIQMERHT